MSIHQRLSDLLPENLPMTRTLAASGIFAVLPLRRIASQLPALRRAFPRKEASNAARGPRESYIRRFHTWPRVP